MAFNKNKNKFGLTGMEDVKKSQFISKNKSPEKNKFGITETKGFIMDNKKWALYKNTEPIFYVNIILHQLFRHFYST